MREPPEGYLRLTVGPAEVWSWAEAAEEIGTVLETHETLHDWAAGLEGAHALQGRSTVWSIPAPVSGPEGRGRWAVRHFQRGGMMEPLLKDRYVSGPDLPRPLAELCCSTRVRARGISTPAVVAGAVYPAGVFYRGDLITELVPDGTDLRELLFGPLWMEPPPTPAHAADADLDAREDPALARAALEEAGRLIRAMELAGIYHPDLNAANLLVTRAPGADEADGPTPTIHLLDLDRCQTREGGAPAPHGPMRERLERSLRKLGQASGRPLQDHLWEALHEGFEAGPR